MDISIPKNFRRYHPDVIDHLNSIGFFDDTDTMDEKMYMCHDDTFKYIDLPVKTIGMWMSGGADSSLCAWMLCKKIKDENLNINFQPLSVRRGREWNPIYAGNVIDFIEEKLQIRMNDHIVYYPDINDEHQREIKEFWDRDDENFRKGLFQILYSGITCNPPKDDKTIPMNKERSRDEDAERPLKSENGIRFYINPFFNINKKGLAKLYKEHGVLNTLFSKTFSCEGTVEDTKTHTQHCEKCWWCQERFWAFGRYV